MDTESDHQGTHYCDNCTGEIFEKLDLILEKFKLFEEKISKVEINDDPDELNFIINYVNGKGETLKTTKLPPIKINRMK